jgi:chromosome segregation ATPase
MSNKVRDVSGKFASKSEAPRKIRSVNLTDETWQQLATVAEKTGKSRNDFLESLLQGNNPFIETVAVQTQPLREVPSETETDSANIMQQPNSNVYPLMETVQLELEALKQELAGARADYIKLLESSLQVTSELRQEIQRLQVELKGQTISYDTVRKELEESEAELSDLKQKSATAGKDLPDAADLLNQLKTKRKKSTASLADIEGILKMIGG